MKKQTIVKLCGALLLAFMIVGTSTKAHAAYNVYNLSSVDITVSFYTFPPIAIIGPLSVPAGGSVCLVMPGPVVAAIIDGCTYTPPYAGPPTCGVSVLGYVEVTVASGAAFL